MEVDFEKLAKQIALFLKDNGGNNVKLYDLSNSNTYCSYLVFCSCDDTFKTKQLFESLMAYASAQHAQEASFTQGLTSGKWMVADFIDFVVHVLTENQRQHYKIDTLYKNAKSIEF